MTQYRMIIHVTVTDPAQVREYAKTRASDAGLSDAEIESVHNGTIADCISWIFDAGTPEGAGIQIEDSFVESMT